MNYFMDWKDICEDLFKDAWVNIHKNLYAKQEKFKKNEEKKENNMEYMKIFKKEQQEILEKVQEWFPGAFIHKNTIEVFSEKYGNDVNVMV